MARVILHWLLVLVEVAIWVGAFLFASITFWLLRTGDERFVALFIPLVMFILVVVLVAGAWYLRRLRSNRRNYRPPQRQPSFYIALGLTLILALAFTLTAEPADVPRELEELEVGEP